MAENGIPSIVSLKYETVWLEANRVQEAERQFHELEAQRCKKESAKTECQLENQITEAKPKSTLACEIANARERIKMFRRYDDVQMREIDNTRAILERIVNLENEKAAMKKKLAEAVSKMDEVLKKFNRMEAALKSLNASVDLVQKSAGGDILKNGPAEEDDDDVDLFGSDEETEEDTSIKMKRLKEYEDKKAKKPALVAKSSVVLDVKPWDDETDMKELETAVRKVESDGLKWGAAKLVPLAYGIQKLQIVAIVEDDKVSIDWLQESIQEVEHLVQSVDIAAFNKL